jgi:hypothetical protein
MAVDRISPVSAAKKRNPPVPDDQLPDVHTFSDIGYLVYKKMLGKDPTSLKYMMSLMITNEQTASIIARALGGDDLGPWPGKSFDWRSKEFKALLGAFPPCGCYTIVRKLILQRFTQRYGLRLSSRATQVPAREDVHQASSSVPRRHLAPPTQHGFHFRRTEWYGAATEAVGLTSSDGGAHDHWRAEHTEAWRAEPKLHS